MNVNDIRVDQKRHRKQTNTSQSGALASLACNDNSPCYPVHFHALVITTMKRIQLLFSGVC